VKHVNIFKEKFKNVMKDVKYSILLEAS